MTTQTSVKVDEGIDEVRRNLHTLVAPFFDDFTLNHDAMQQTVDLLVNAGVHGIIVAGTTGEYYAMSMKERVYMMGVAKEMIAGAFP